jgi:hypothetical protein
VQLVLWAVKALLDLLVVMEQLDIVVVLVCQAPAAKLVLLAFREQLVHWDSLAVKAALARWDL